MDVPFEIYAVNSAFRRLQRIGDPNSATFTPRHRGQGSGQLVLDARDSNNEWLLEKGSRLIVRYKGEHLMSGKVRAPAGELQEGRSITYQLQDDYRWLANTLAYIRPAGPVAPTNMTAGDPGSLGQAWLPAGAVAGASGTVAGQFPYFLWPDSITTAEAAVKHVIHANFDRMNRLRPNRRRYLATPDQGRGGNARAAGILPQLRLGTLLDAADPLLDWSGLGIRIWQEPFGPQGAYVDVYQPAVRAQALTLESGILQSGKWSLADTSATAGLVGGPGELAARAFREFVDLEREAEEGDAIEVFREATSAALNWPDSLDDSLKVAKYYVLRAGIPDADKARFLAELDAAGQKSLDEAAPTAGVSATVSETDDFAYGGPRGFHVGDRMKVATSQGMIFEDAVTECTLSIGSDGFKVTPTIGEKKDDPQAATMRAIVRLARSNSRNQARK
jgi:hypothetical protein